MFVDETKIQIKAGDGGKGCLSYVKSTHRNFKGPDGGNGGKGGDVWFEVNKKLNSLLIYRYQRHFSAGEGEPGQKRRDGKNAEDLILKVPEGTCIYDEQGELLADLNHDGQRWMAARGGIGGKGNRSLANKFNSCPGFAEKGEPGEIFWLKIELKLSADMGIIGFPNVGKSTLIAKISNAKPKIADYPFTTLEPNLGMVEINQERSILIADIPGIIEGAHEGHGLGHQFLRHIERTGALIHMIDLFPYDGTDPWESYLTVNAELASYSEKLSKKPQIVVLNKLDMPMSKEKMQDFLEKSASSSESILVHGISALTGEGVRELVWKLAELLEKYPPQKELYESKVRQREERMLKILKEEDGFRITGDKIERMARMTNFENDDALQRFHHVLKMQGIIDRLKKRGAVEGTPVYIAEFELMFHDDTWENEFEIPEEDERVLFFEAGEEE